MTRPESARTRLLDAALALIRENGFAATTVDALCERAGVTKGAFFHHFAGKDALGEAACAHWTEITGSLFASASYHSPADPLDRVLAYVDFRRALIEGSPSEFTCLAGTLAQEVHASHPAIRDAAGASIFGHAATLVADIEAAMRQHGLAGEFTAESLAVHTQAVLQGAFVLAKARGDAAIARESVDHLRRYIVLLFAHAPTSTSREAKP